jgi:hypothetical protein
MGSKALKYFAGGLLVLSAAVEFNAISHGDLTAKTATSFEQCTQASQSCNASQSAEALKYSTSSGSVLTLLMGAGLVGLGARRKTLQTQRI